MNSDFTTYLKVYRPSFYEAIKVEYLRFKNEFKMIERQKQENAIAIKRLSDEKQIEATYKTIVLEKEQQEKKRAIKRQREAKQAVEAYKQKLEEQERQETAKSNERIKAAKDAFEDFNKAVVQEEKAIQVVEDLKAVERQKRLEAVEKKPKRKEVVLDDPNLCVCRNPNKFNKYSRGWCSHKCVENNISRYEINRTEMLCREWCS